MKSCYIRKSLKASLLKLFLFSALILVFGVQRSSASHAAGADLTYRWLSGNAFEVTATFYRDCFGVDAPVSIPVTYASVSCAFSSTANLLPITGTGQEISHPCPGNPTTCTGGTQPGIQEWVYRGTIVLPSQCTDWKFSYQVLARNCAITTIVQPIPCSPTTATAAIYVEATLNNVAAPHNNSPTFSNKPVAFVCIGQDFTYNAGLTNIDGDSLVYSLITPMTDGIGGTVTFIPPYSATQPISGVVTLNANNGDIFMHPTNSEVGVISVLIKEYRNGVLIGSVIRDMQIYTINCINKLPTATGIDGTNNFSDTVCAGNTISFNVFSNDSDATQIVTMTWNNGIPAPASFTITGTPHPTGNFSWTPSSSDVRSTPYTFTVTVIDNACPINGVQIYSYSILVQELILSTSSSPDVCSRSTGTATVSASGGSGNYSYSWSPSGGNGATATGLAAGTYTVLVIDAGGCSSTQSVVVPADNSNCCALVLATSSTPDRCGRNNGMAIISVSGGIAPFTYAWSPAGGNASTASNLPAGNYVVNVTDGNGCTASQGVVVAADNTNCCCNLLLAISSKSNATCEGGDNGSATVSASNGIPPYTYQWTPIGGTNSTATGLAPGTYNVLVSPYVGCSASISVTIGFDHPAPHVDLGPDTNICIGKTLILDAGPGVSYLWSTNETTRTITVSAAGIYGVVVTDAFGCQGSDVIRVNYIQCRISHSKTDDHLSVYPNPANDVLNISISDLKNETVSTELYDILGNKIIFLSEKAEGNIYESRIDIDNLPRGVYMLKIQYNDKVKTIKVIKD